MAFWQTPIGRITGDESVAFSHPQVKSIPNNTTAIAKIKEFKKKTFMDNSYYQVDWVITDGQFKNHHVFQKIRAFDADDKKRYKALNLLMFFFKFFNVGLTHEGEPTDHDLAEFEGLSAGIRIHETEENADGKIYNWVGQIMPTIDFKCETGIHLATQKRATAPRDMSYPFQENPKRQPNGNVAHDIIDDTIPF